MQIQLMRKNPGERAWVPGSWKFLGNVLAPRSIRQDPLAIKTEEGFRHCLRRAYLEGLVDRNLLGINFDSVVLHNHGTKIPCVRFSGMAFDHYRMQVVMEKPEAVDLRGCVYGRPAMRLQLLYLSDMVNARSLSVIEGVGVYEEAMLAFHDRKSRPEETLLDLRDVVFQGFSQATCVQYRLDHSGGEKPSHAWLEPIPCRV